MAELETTTVQSSTQTGAYADNIVVIASDERNLEDAVQKLTREAERRELEINQNIHDNL